MITATVSLLTLKGLECLHRRQVCMGITKTDIGMDLGLFPSTSATTTRTRNENYFTVDTLIVKKTLSFIDVMSRIDIKSCHVSISCPCHVSISRVYIRSVNAVDGPIGQCSYVSSHVAYI